MLHQDESDPQIQQMKEHFKQWADARAFNPEGMFKSQTFHKEEIKEFILKWQQQYQVLAAA